MEIVNTELHETSNSFENVKFYVETTVKVEYDDRF